MYKTRQKRNINFSMSPGKLPDVSSMVSIPAESDSFFQFEPAVVLDSILDETHPFFRSNNSIISPNTTPKQWDGSAHIDQPRFSQIGSIKARMLYSEKGAAAESLRWAFPLSPSVAEIPLINELVQLVDIRGNLYYTSRINHNSRLNFGGDFSAELYSSNGFGRPIDPSLDPSDTPVEYIGPKIEVTFADKDYPKNFGVGGKYFSFNSNIRKLRRFEGDYIIESRFGQSIRMGVYDESRANDKGDQKNSDYFSPSENPASDEQSGYGNPFFLIRNRQRQLTTTENHFYSTIQEDINLDGSSIHITSGLTVSKFNRKSIFKKFIFSSDEGEEQTSFSPSGSTEFKFPILNGDQIITISDRLVFGSRTAETLFFSKKRFGIISDSEVSIDAHEQLVLTTNVKTVINSPFVYLGEYNQTKEPAVLGETMIEWLYELGEWLKTHTHYYHHSHPSAGAANPNKTQAPKQIRELENLIQKLPLTLSKRVFITGGGHAPGSDGKSIEGLNNGSVGKIASVPGGYFVPTVGSFNGSISSD